MQLLIIRHGDPDYRLDSLTEKGFREASLLANRLASSGVRDFYVSPLGRAMDTARPALQRLEKKPVVCDWLQEFPITFPDPRTGETHIIWDYMPAYRAQPASGSNFPVILVVQEIFGVHEQGYLSSPRQAGLSGDCARALRASGRSAEVQQYAGTDE